jgi:predicted dehydrogenase
LLIVGVGSVGTRHLENLRRLGHDDVVLYRTGHRPRLTPVPEAPSENDLEGALARQPQAALICNPTALHVPVALAAARAGCHLFVEKPLSHSMEGVVELRREIERRGLTALVGFQFRFHPALRQVKAWLEDGAIGEVVSVRAHWGEYLPAWQPEADYRTSYSARRALGGGVVLTLCHPFDYLRWLVGEVVEVCAQTGQRSGLEIDVEDTANVLLRFAGGALGCVSLDYVSRPPSHGLELVGRRGLIRWQDVDGAAHLFEGQGGRQCSFFHPSGFGRNDMFVEEMRHFLACLAGRERPACSFEDGLRALQIALAAKQSADEGRAVAL